MARSFAALIRHGDYHQLDQTPSAHQPFPLNDAGEAQAKACIPLIKELCQAHGWVLNPRAHASTLLRAWQTATLLQAGLDGLEEIKSHDDLAERGLGSAANLTTDAIREIMDADPRFAGSLPEEWKSNSHYRLPLMGAESLMNAGGRVAGYLHKNTIANGQDTLTLFIGHGAAFRHAAHHLGILDFDDIARLSMYHARPVVLEKRLDGRWKYTTGEWKVRPPKEEALD